MCLEVCGLGLSESARRQIVDTAHVIARWIDAGLDLQMDVLPVLRERTAHPRKNIIRTWEYFSAAIRRAHEHRMHHAEQPKDAESEKARFASIDNDHQAWLHALAETINSRRYVSPSAVNNTTRDKLLASGLVTRERLRELQVY